MEATGGQRKMQPATQRSVWENSTVVEERFESVKNKWVHYGVWRRVATDRVWGPWLRTSHTIKARTPFEASSKLKRMFSNAGFHSMSLIAVPFWDNPNKKGQS